MIQVKVGKLPGKIEEFVLEDGSTVQDALDEAELEVEDGYEIRINTKEATVETVLKEGNAVLLVRQIKGNLPEDEDPGYIKVKVGKLPGKIQEFALNGGRQVTDALTAAELKVEDGYEIRVNTKEATVETALKEGDAVLLVRQIKGNR